MTKPQDRDSQSEPIDVVDANDRPLCVMPLAEARRQSLPRRCVVILVRDANGRLFLRKRGPEKQLYPGRYDLSAAAHVRAGEARLDAAERELKNALGLTAKTFRPLAQVPASRETAFEGIALFEAAGLAGSPPDALLRDVDGMFADRTELACLANRYRDLLTPALVYLFEKGLLFLNRPAAGANEP